MPWKEIYQNNSRIFAEGWMAMAEYCFYSSDGEQITIKIYESSDGNFMALESHHPQLLTAGPYITNNRYGNTQEEALENLLHAWQVQYHSEPLSSIKWSPRGRWAGKMLTK